MSYTFTHYLEWRNWVIPRELRSRPIHRWFVFPHSYSDKLVRALLYEWGMGSEDVVVDPFSGAGTTVLAAKQLGISAVGFDLSPLAVLVGQAKVANHDVEILRQRWSQLRPHVGVRDELEEGADYPRLVQRALPGRKLATFHAVRILLERVDLPPEAKAFFMVALLTVVQKFSHAVATGGWLRWRTNDRSAERIPTELDQTVNSMLADLEFAEKPAGGCWTVELADARTLPLTDESCSCVISSPPYPNRHDYTRIFGVELLFAFLDSEGARQLRYQTFHSHPEAKPLRPQAEGYEEPPFVQNAVKRLCNGQVSKRILRMIKGYFVDLYISLREIARILRPAGRVALVLGNVQYAGVAIDVDRAAAFLGELVGLKCIEIRVVRERGNSAQQMRLYGRQPARESVVIFRKGS